MTASASRIRRVRRIVATGSVTGFLAVWIAVAGLGAGKSSTSTTTQAAASVAATADDDSGTSDQALPEVQTSQS